MDYNFTEYRKITDSYENYFEERSDDEILDDLVSVGFNREELDELYCNLIKSFAQDICEDYFYYNDYPFAIIEKSGLLDQIVNIEFNGYYHNAADVFEKLPALERLVYINGQDSVLPSFGSLTKLTKLIICGGEGRYIDITSLSSLTNLTELSIIEYTIADLTPLSGLTNLTKLSVDSSKLSTDLTPLGSLTKLTELRFSGIEALSDDSPLDSLTDEDESTDFASLIMKYAEPPCSVIPHFDITPLSGLTNLTVLNILGTRIADLSPLDHLVANGLLLIDDGPIEF